MATKSKINTKLFFQVSCLFFFTFRSNLRVFNLHDFNPTVSVMLKCIFSKLRRTKRIAIYQQVSKFLKTVWSVYKVMDRRINFLHNQN